MVKGKQKQKQVDVDGTAQLLSCPGKKKGNIQKEQKAGEWPPKNTLERTELVKELKSVLEFFAETRQPV